MIRKALYAAGLLAFAGSAHAATDYPSGYTKCAKEGETCTFSGTRSVAYGKAGTFVYANLTGPISCAASRFPAISVGTPRYCSYGAVTTPPDLPRHDHRPGHQRRAVCQRNGCFRRFGGLRSDADLGR